MKRIVLNETQAEKLMNKIISEQEDSEKYHQQVKCNIYSHNVTYKGFEINDISSPNIILSFDIDIEYKSYGLKNISVNRINGPSEIETDIDYYETEDGDSTSDILTLHMNWETAEISQDDSMGWIGINSEIEVDLINDQDGNLVVSKIVIPINSL